MNEPKFKVGDIIHLAPTGEKDYNVLAKIVSVNVARQMYHYTFVRHDLSEQVGLTHCYDIGYIDVTSYLVNARYHYIWCNLNDL